MRYIVLFHGKTQPPRHSRTLAVDHATAKFRTFLTSAQRLFKQAWMTYGHYGAEIGFCTCLARHAWFKYPVMAEVTYTTLGRARHMVTTFFEDFVQGFLESQRGSAYQPEIQQPHHHPHEGYTYSRVSNKISDMTAPDYYDYQNNVGTQEYGPSRRIGDQNVQAMPQDIQNLKVIEKADPKLISVVDMLKNLQPKVNQNDSFIIRYARALNLYSQKLQSSSSDDDDEKMRSISKDKIKKYRKKYQRDSSNGTSVSTAAYSSSIHANKTREGRSMGANRRVLVPGVPPGLPSYDELPPADYTYVKNNVVHHVHDLRNGKYRPKRFFLDDFMGSAEEAVLGWLGFPPPHKLTGGPTVMSCAKGYAVSIVMRHIHMLLFG